MVADPGQTAIHLLWDRWQAERRRLVAPTLIRYEVTNALHRYRRQGLRTASATRRALRAVFELPIQLDAEPALHGRALDVAERFNLPAAYDAHYVALAEHLDAPFWTADRRLVNAVGTALPWVHLAEA